jgi:hypothetical protein
MSISYSLHWNVSTNARGKVWKGKSSKNRLGLAGTVEVYECSSCKTLTRFPRYNHAGKLLKTKRGRCGEW